MKKLLTIIGLTLAVMAATLPAAMAQVEINPDLHPQYAPVISSPNIKNAADYGNFFLQLVAGGLLYLAGPTAILFIALAGLRYVTAHGDQNQLEGAKKTLEWAMIGLVVVIFAFALVRIIISTTLNINTQQQTTTNSSTSAQNP